MRDLASVGSALGGIDVVAILHLVPKCNEHDLDFSLFLNVLQMQTIGQIWAD